MILLNVSKKRKENILKQQNQGMNKSLMDLIWKNRKLSEIPDKVMKLAESLELDIFPKK